MDRPRRDKKSTKSNLFYYPSVKKRSRAKNQRNAENRSVRPRIDPDRPASPNPDLAVNYPEAAPAENRTVTPEQTVTAQAEVQPEVAARATNQPLTEKEIIEQLYLNPNFPSSYSGNLRKFLLEKESISRHKNRVKIFKRRKIFVQGPFTLLMSDTIHYRQYYKQNKGFRYILVVVDCFSRKNWCCPQRTVTARETAENLDKIISSMEFKPRQFCTDQGTEFDVRNPYIFRVLVEKFGMVLFTLKGPHKASMAERFIRTLKSRLERYFTEHNTFKWYDVLEKFSDNLNNTIHSTTGFAPNNVNFENRDKIYNKIYGSPAPPLSCRYNTGDIVRIPERKNIFSKGYKVNWTKELYKVARVHSDKSVCYYSIETADGEPIERKFYTQELNLVIKKS